MTTVAGQDAAAKANKAARDSKGARPDTMEVKDGRLLIDVGLSNGTPSASGKSKVYFTTSGNISLNGGYKLGVNLYKSSKG